MFSLSACATKGALKRGLEAQTAALDAERTARVQADEAQKADIASLRTDLQNLRTEFGAKITEVSQGLQFAFPVHFAFNDANVRTEDSAALDRFADVVSKHYNGAKVTVEGFADPAGSQRYNLDLSQRRADAVKAYVSSKGLDASLVNAVGYGENRQVNAGAWGDQPGADLNRRVVFVIETPANADANKVTASVE
ncbi:MAG TPA: OmpA family protein [Gemmatimonadaceae bacterium]|jgi:peptidoglycan-associated lipoprotein|nr:OmpA family protein [Gemmatimonadaceae bacterium]